MSGSMKQRALQSIAGRRRWLHHLLILSLILTPVIRTDGDDSTSTLTPPPGSYRVLSEDRIITFPFEVFRGDIRFRAEINGREVYMLLDDGFMWDQILFWGSPTVDSLNLNYDGETDIGGGPDDDASIASRTASGITIRFPGVEFTDQTAVVTPYSSGVSNMWQGSIGQVSGTFLKHFVVDINFDDMMITLIEPHKFVYRGQGAEIPWTPLGFGPWAIPASLSLTDGRSVSMDLMMDLGYNDQLQIATRGEHDITVPERALPASLGRNIQGTETLGHIGRLPSVIIGGYEIKDVLSGFVSEEHSGHTFHEGMIGLGLLSHFNLVFDYSRQRLFVEPNRNFTAPFIYNMSGLALRPGSGNYLSIQRVHSDSPASEAGLQVGDRVIQINRRSVTEYDFWELQ
ncbi:MAG: PDZ domain-containing protein, partial [Candidatus Zixiibacteriota bacterium]